MLRYTAAVQPLSCDEAYLDLTGLGDPDALVAALRADIAATTGCTASAGARARARCAAAPCLIAAAAAAVHPAPAFAAALCATAEHHTSTH